MFYPICTSLDRIQSFALDLNWNGSKREHFGKRSQTGTDSGSVPVWIQHVQCERKAYLYPYWYGSVYLSPLALTTLLFAPVIFCLLSRFRTPNLKVRHKKIDTRSFFKLYVLHEYILSQALLLTYLIVPCWYNGSY